MTVFVTPETSMTGDFSNIDQIGVFFINDSGELACAGASSFVADGNFQITVWGSEAGADNGMGDGDEVIWLAETSDGVIYNVSAEYQTEAMANYTLNTISFVTALNFNLDNSSIIEGCMNENACNYDAAAEQNNGSCEYPAEGFDCEGNSNLEPCATIDFSYNNTGVNMTLLVLEGTNLIDGSTIGAFVGDLCVGSISISEGAFQIAVWGDDSSTEEVDGATNGDIISLVAQNESGLFLTSTEFGYDLNAIEVIQSITFNYECGTVLAGCTDTGAFNYDADANTDDGSCVAVVEGCMDATAFNYNADANTDDGSCVAVVNGCTDVVAFNYNADANTDDGSCIAVVNGCTDATAFNYDANANTDDGSCLEMVSGCTDESACNFDSAATQEDSSCTYPGCIDNTFIEYYNQGYIAGCDDGSCSIDLEDLGLVVENFQEPMVTGSNMTIGFNISNINGIQEGTVAAFYDLNGDGIINTDSYMASNGLYYSECIGFTEYMPNEFFSLALWGDDNSTDEIEGLQNGQSDVVFAILTEDNQVIAFNLDPEFTNYTTNGMLVVNEINLNVTIYGCMNSDYCNYNADAEEDDGSCEGIPGCMDISYLEYDSTSGCNNQAMCVVTWQQAYNLSQDTISMVNALNNSLLDSLEQEQINHLNTQIDFDSLQSQLAICNENLNYWSSPIIIDLLTGWNMIGYTFPEPQDVVASVAEIDDIIEVIKDNNGEVYWPEFGFNGIGDFTPGHGYQIKVSEEYLGFTYPDVSGQRIELTPTVPIWAIDMEVEIHPNDIRTLVRVVNMLGQEVDPEMEPRGSVLLYLYNDATVEKKLVE